VKEARLQRENSPRAGFQPPWWATLGTLVLGALFVSAGFWQLGRADEKRALFDRFATGASQPGIEPPAGDADLTALRYHAVTVAGHYDTTHQVLLDARMHDGRAGYEVLTPLLRPAGHEPAMLINRGWLPADPDRRRLPDVSVAPGPRVVRGLLDELPRAGLVAGPAPAEAAPRWPRRLLYPTRAEIGTALGYPVAPYQLLLAREAPDGYLRDWRPGGMTPQQHVGYAVQWFALAGALAVLYAIVNWRKARPSATGT
jgi:surfeit locus 1 family protein